MVLQAPHRVWLRDIASYYGFTALEWELVMQGLDTQSRSPNLPNNIPQKIDLTV